MDRVCGNERDEGQINVKLFINFFCCCSLYRFASPCCVLCVDHINIHNFFFSLPLSSVVACRKFVCEWRSIFDGFFFLFVQWIWRYKVLSKCTIKIQYGWLSHMFLWFCVVDCRGVGYPNVCIRLRLALRFIQHSDVLKTFFSSLPLFLSNYVELMKPTQHDVMERRKKSNNAKLCSFNRCFTLPHGTTYHQPNEKKK